MSAIHIRIGQNLQRVRKQRQLSLDKVAELTGVSKGMLHQIERGDTQPTVTTVWKIATGLNLSFSSLIKVDESEISITRRKEIPDITEDNGNVQVYVGFPFNPQTQIEIFTIVIKPKGNYISAPHNEGVQEYITVTSGKFTINIRDEEHTLFAGDTIHFAGNVTHQYRNDEDKDVTLQVVMHYPES
ncbi:XRE family transcriptional regulator [Brevibacillus ruminantium]|uniref:XRE family transcriptional regulator n=1 Tax=Brevibacillus ruminantium TaxID=2950604 RepID=A0ABY4WNH0_9BACL|nr:XRE family transcriptional regulator [Brevibacillus ruminantium]USG68234.1 XRE family transcriptional regulator [Brevibacillus ruminantium]